MKDDDYRIVCDKCEKILLERDEGKGKYIKVNDYVSLKFLKVVKADNYYTKEVKCRDTAHLCLKCLTTMEKWLEK